MLKLYLLLKGADLTSGAACDWNRLATRRAPRVLTLENMGCDGWLEVTIGFSHIFIGHSPSVGGAIRYAGHINL